MDKVKESVLELSVDGLIEMFSKGRFASVLFEKQDGTLRKLTGKSFVNKDIKGTGNYDARSKNQVRIFDVNVKNDNGTRGGWRTVTVDKVKQVTSNGQTWIANDR